MTKFLLIASSVLAVGVLTTAAWTPMADAVEYGGIGLKPAQPKVNNPRTQSIFIYELKAGATQTDAVRIINNTSKPHPVTIYAVDSVPSSDGAFACAQAVEEKKGVGDWIHLSRSQVTLQPLTNQVVPFSVILPATASTGEHDGCIVIQDAAPTAAQAASGITLSFRSAVRVAITVPGTIITKLHLDSVSQKSTSRTTLTVSPSYTNGGNVSLDTTITVRLATIFGHSSSDSHGQFPVLPHTTSRFNLEVKKPFWGGLYKRQVSTSYRMLTAGGSTDTSAHTLPTATTWTVLAPRPLALLIECITGVVILAALVVWFMRRRAHHLLLVATEDYKVKKGDNIQALAEKHHIDWKKLAKINHLRPPYALTVGEHIKVPKKVPASQPADTAE